jgi:hypothetical protein
MGENWKNWLYMSCRNTHFNLDDAKWASLVCFFYRKLNGSYPLGANLSCIYDAVWLGSFKQHLHDASWLAQLKSWVCVDV